MTQLPPSTLAGHIISRCQAKRSISSPEAAILLVCARNRDLWAKLKARQKDGQISLAVETCSFQPQSPTHAQNQTGTRISWFRFWIRPEPLRFTTAGQGDAGSGDEIEKAIFLCQQSCQKILSITAPLVEMLVDNTVYQEIYTINV